MLGGQRAPGVHGARRGSWGGQLQSRQPLREGGIVGSIPGNGFCGRDKVGSVDVNSVEKPRIKKSISALLFNMEKGYQLGRIIFPTVREKDIIKTFTTYNVELDR